MSGRIFQNVVLQLKENTDRTVGVIDGEGIVIACFEDSFQSLSLVEAHVCVAVSIFNTDNHVVNDCYTWTIAQELLVGWFCIILLCFDELMGKVKIILLTGFQLASSKQGINQ